MHAGVVAFRVRPDRMEEAVRTYLSSVVPALKEQQGFRGVLVLTDNEADEGYSISLWETEDDAEESESSGIYRKQIAKLGGLLVETPVRKIYEVSIQMWVRSRARETLWRVVLQQGDLVTRSDLAALDYPGADATALP
jgi:heme-degrading monooxygenase HmoA